MNDDMYTRVEPENPVGESHGAYGTQTVTSINDKNEKSAFYDLSGNELFHSEL